VPVLSRVENDLSSCPWAPGSRLFFDEQRNCKSQRLDFVLQTVAIHLLLPQDLVDIFHC
jgi:hypothetical protein